MPPAEPFDSLRPDRQAEIRKQRAAGGYYSLQVESVLELTNLGPRLALFQKSHKLDVGPEQMICLLTPAVFVSATTMMAAMLGLNVQFSPMAIPGMTPGDPNAPQS